MSTFHHFVCEW